MERKDCQIVVRLDAETRARLEAQAAADDRSLSSFVRLLIRRALESEPPAEKAGGQTEVTRGRRQ